MLFGLTACHEVNETAVTVGTEEFTSAFYSCALVYADLEAQQIVYDTLGETAYADYLNQKIDGVDYVTWVKNRAVETIKEMAAYKLACDDLLIMPDEYSSDDVSAADLEWSNYYSVIMQENGVGRGTFRWYNSMDTYKLTLFDYVYGKGGEKEIPAADVETKLTTDFAISNIISADATGKTEDELKDIVAKLEGYATRIQQGEKFEKIYAEYMGTTYTDSNAESKKTFSYGYASLFGAEGTGFESDYYEDVKALANGEIKVVTKTDDSDKKNVTTTVLLIYKGDVLDAENPNAEDIKKIAMHSLKDEEFEKSMEESIKNLTVEVNERATKRFKVEKIVYPTGY
jgi:hypothetical protein